MGFWRNPCSQELEEKQIAILTRTQLALRKTKRPISVSGALLCNKDKMRGKVVGLVRAATMAQQHRKLIVAIQFNFSHLCSICRWKVADIWQQLIAEVEVAAEQKSKSVDWGDGSVQRFAFLAGKIVGI